MESLSKEFVDCFVAAITTRPEDFRFHTRIKGDRFEHLLCDDSTGYKINVEHVYLVEPFSLTFEEDDKQRLIEAIEGFKQGHVRGMFNRALMEPRKYAEPTGDKTFLVDEYILKREAAQLTERQREALQGRFTLDLHGWGAAERARKQQRMIEAIEGLKQGHVHITYSDNTKSSFP